ncbi:MAG: nicotinate-nucleotide adenylyltransferase [Proteobacteria bacterium]|nr:nicotinate-nucleotide adenylyltransferase [Pseudomonadota bacterium]
MTAPDAGNAVGVYGGTFNPIHLGHLRAAEEVAECLGLERVIFVPSARPPHKSDGEEIAPAQQRFEWVKLAVASNPRFEVDPIEVEREGPSYSVTTLVELRRRLAPAVPVFIIGHDAFCEIGTWREPKALFALAHFAVMTRPPERDGRLAAWLPECMRDEIEFDEDGLSGRHRVSDHWIRAVKIRGLDVSASGIRQRIREGRSTRYWLPEPVRREVEKSGCYRDRAEARS